MEKMMKEYAAFERAMNEGKVYRDLDYETICLSLGVDPGRFEALLKSELGFEGQELVDYYLAKFG